MESEQTKEGKLIRFLQQETTSIHCRHHLRQMLLHVQNLFPKVFLPIWVLYYFYFLIFWWITLKFCNFHLCQLYSCFSVPLASSCQQLEKIVIQILSYSLRHSKCFFFRNRKDNFLFSKINLIDNLAVKDQFWDLKMITKFKGFN